MKQIIIIKIFYLVAIIGFVTYLITKKSGFMFCGGLLLIVASTLKIINDKNKK